jgi:hypothetical protein
LVDALGNFEKTIEELLEKPLPTSFTGYLSWTFDIIKGLLSGGWHTLVAVAESIGEIYDRAKAAAVGYIDYLVRQGRIGVRQSTYSGILGSTRIADTYKIHLPGLPDLDGEADEGSFVLNSDTAIGYPLWKVLKWIGAKPTNDRDDFWVY